MTKPAVLVRAELLDALGQRYGKFPREVEEEDASLLQLVAIASMGMKETDVSS